MEHTLSFFELDTTKSLDILKATCSELRKLDGDLHRQLIQLETVVFSRENRNKELENIILQQREQLQLQMLQINDTYAQDLLKLESHIRNFSMKWDGFNIRIEALEKSIKDRLDHEREEIRNREDMRDDIIERL